MIGFCQWCYGKGGDGDSDRVFMAVTVVACQYDIDYSKALFFGLPWIPNYLPSDFLDETTKVDLISCAIQGALRLKFKRVVSEFSIEVNSKTSIPRNLINI